MKLYDPILNKPLEVVWEMEGGSIKGSVKTYSLKVVGINGYKFGYLLEDGRVVDQWERPLRVIENSPIKKKVIEEKKKESSFWSSF